MWALVTKMCRTLWELMDCSPLSTSVYESLQARILEWVAIPFSGGSFQPRDWTCISCIAGRFLTAWATREAQPHQKLLQIIPIHEHCNFLKLDVYIYILYFIHIFIIVVKYKLYLNGLFYTKPDIHHILKRQL